MDTPVMNWYLLTESNAPYKGQLVEVLCWKPAIYDGKNDLGYDEWRFFNDWEKVFYWKDPSNRAVIDYVLTKIHPK